VRALIASVTLARLWPTALEVLGEEPQLQPLQVIGEQQQLGQVRFDGSTNALRHSRQREGATGQSRPGRP
jgi:hypothetical protein